MLLRELLRYDHIVIQGHDNPDADAIASAYGLYLYFRAAGRNVRMIYGGKNAVSKKNLLLMLEKLAVPMEHVTRLDERPGLLITVDCQYTEKNVQRFEAENVAVIDHHMPAFRRECSVKGVGGEELPLMNEIRENYGSCATVVWDMLKSEGFPVTNDMSLATALYYGLFSDTGKFQEIRHPKDRDMRDELEFCLNRSILMLLENSNLSQEELLIAGKAMAKVDYEEDCGFAIAQAEKCDPNILGIISDALIEVDSIGCCVAFCAVDDGVKLSVRSCERETRADELAAYMTDGIGSGGGHMRKSGGFLVEDLLIEEYCRLFGDTATDTAQAAHAVLRFRMREYFRNQVFIYAGSENVPDLSGEKMYRKKCLPMGYVKATDLYPEGTMVSVRMLEGDVRFTVRSDTYFVIGIEGEVYKNDESYFLAHNTPIDEPYVYSGEYAPTVQAAVRAISIGEDDRKQLTDYAKVCIPKKGSCIRARELEVRTKVFVPWSESYLLGKPGDYLAARAEDPGDVYIINRQIMARSYEEVD